MLYWLSVLPSIGNNDTHQSEWHSTQHLSNRDTQNNDTQYWIDADGHK